MLAEFDYASYGNLLEGLLDQNANIGFPEAIDFTGRYFILRHDVDFSPSAALRMAEFEADRGVRATYFLLLSAAEYNLLDPEHCRLPARLVELGHEVGLHYDLGTFDVVAPESRPGLLCLQADILATLSSAPVRVISMHQPSLSGPDPFRRGTAFVNAYDDRFTREIAYISDSCGAWRDEAIAHFEGRHVPAQLQLLVHPLFWEDVGVDRWSVLERFVAHRTQVVRTRAEVVGASWTAHAGVFEHDRRTTAT